MSWKEVSPGRYERPLNGIELIVVAKDGGDREHFSLTSAVRVTIDLPLEERVSALREAWKAMRHDYPMIAAWRSGTSMVYETPNPAALDTWLKETFVVTTEPATAEDLVASFRPGPLATLHYLPHTSEIVLHSSHWRIDGVGMLLFLDRFFQAVVEPRKVQFGDEHVRLSPDLEHVLSTTAPATPETERTAEAMFRVLADNAPSMGFGVSPAAAPEGTRRRAVRFSQQDTTALLAACKERGFRITAAVQAAMLVATQEFASPATRNRPHIQVCPTNLRPYLEPPFNSPDHAVIIYATSFPLALSPHGTFAEHVATLREFYARDISPATSPALSAVAGYHYRLAVESPKLPPDCLPFSTEPFVDSLGLLDQYMSSEYGGGRVRVEEYYFMAEMLAKELIVPIWTFRGQLELSVCYNEALYKPEFIQKLLQRISAILVTELGLPNCSPVPSSSWVVESKPESSSARKSTGTKKSRIFGNWRDDKGGKSKWSLSLSSLFFSFPVVASLPVLRKLI
ncbi:hypothetical protein VTN00DRAFT_9727 [Thermoascus crustaceus]|uniref:uncharacterized protein n=1 Tax=Thermoascus crustaceus TaxID=5088 RepID=UPI003743558F